MVVVVVGFFFFLVKLADYWGWVEADGMKGCWICASGIRGS